MSDLGLNTKSPDTRTTPPGLLSTSLAALLLVLGIAIPGASSRSVLAQSQDTIRVGGVVLAPDDSAEARRLLRADLGPTSRRWTRLQDSTKRFQAAKTLFQVAHLAYPDGTWADSVLAFLREAGTDHSNPEVRAEFLYAGLQVAESAERDQARRQFYEQLTGDHKESHYAKEARRLFAPGSQVQAGKELPEFQFPRLSDSTATFTKSDFEGKTFLIDLWGTWCPPCIRAMPHLHEAYRKHGGEDFTILSVAMRDTRAAVKQFRSQKWEMPWNHAFVPKGSDLQRRLRSQFNISSFPMAILVGPDGQILSVNRGAESGEKMAQAIREALAPASDSGKASPESPRPGATDPGGSDL